MSIELLLTAALSCVGILAYATWHFARRLKAGEVQTPDSLSLAATVLYAASLALPAFDCGSGSGASFPGWVVLLIGFMGLLMLDPRWFGNVGFFLLLVSMLRRSGPRVHRPKLALMTGVFAIFSFAPAAGCEGGGGAAAVSEGLAVGGVLWVGALLLICMANFLGHRPSSSSEKREDDE